MIIGKTPLTILAHAFDRFYRVGDNSHDEIKSNGLELDIVKSIIEQHGRQINVESEPGKGCCFTFTLPLIAEHNQATDDVKLFSISDQTQGG